MERYGKSYNELNNDELLARATEAAKIRLLKPGEEYSTGVKSGGVHKTFTN